jgi:hypothetical protein
MNKLREYPFQLAMAAGLSDESDKIDLAIYSNMHKYSLQVTVTGAGALDLVALCSNDGLNYRESTEAAILSNFKVTDGPNSDGISAPKDFKVPLCRYIKIQGTEKVGDDSVAATIVVCIQ